MSEPQRVPGQPAGGDYGYDWVGNRLHPPAGDTDKMVYNDADQLLMWPGMHGKWNGQTLVPGYAYDGAGNLTAVKDASGSTTIAGYTYTPAGLLSEATYKDKDGNNRTLSNTWDADSNRVSFDANGTEYELVYDPTAPKAFGAVIEESTSSSTVYYIREPGGSLIARLNTTAGIRYYHFDELGSTRLLTNASGAITDRYTYDAYGSLLSHDCLEGSVEQPCQYVGELGYYTHHMEPDFGLLQLGVRFYDAEVGRFAQRDGPATDVPSPYLYVGGSVLAAVDPSGLIPRPLPPIDPKNPIPCGRCHDPNDASAGEALEFAQDLLRNEKKFGECVAKCLWRVIGDPISKIGGGAAAVATVCFSRGKWIGGKACVRAISAAIDAARRALGGKKCIKKAGLVSLVGIGAVVVGCELKCGFWPDALY